MWENHAGNVTPDIGATTLTRTESKRLIKTAGVSSETEDWYSSRFAQIIQQNPANVDSVFDFRFFM